MTVVDLRLDHLGIATRYAAEAHRWPVTPRFNPVDRWYHRLHEADDHEVWLLTWLPGQGTDLHDHGGSAGAFHVFAGTLTEDTVQVAAPGTTAHGTTPRRAGTVPEGQVRITGRELGEGAGRRFGTRHIHRITNRSARPAVSIHVYGPALTTMTRYRIGDTGRLEVRTVERAGVQW